MHIRSRLTTEQQTFIQDFAKLEAATGFPLSTRRVLAYLIICVKPEQTAKDIMSMLQLSAGSVSGALGSLEAIGLVGSVKLPKIRQVYYSVNTDGWSRAVAQRVNAIHDVAMFAQKAHQNAPDNQRLVALRDTYVLFDTKLRNIV